MQTALRAVRRRSQLGAKLHQPYQGLASLGVYHRRGQVSLIAAATGGGKSAYALNYAIKCDARTLYFSADTDLVTMGMRAAAVKCGLPLADIEANLDTVEVSRLLADIESVSFCPDSSPSIADITEEVRAYVEVYGVFPELIVVDNLINVRGEGESKWDKVRGVVDSLRNLARETNAHVLVLCHTTGGWSSIATPIPLGGLEFKPGNNVELVLTLHRPADYTMSVCVVKHRNGTADADANLRVGLYCDLSRMEIDNMPTNAPWIGAQ